ncbi:hypothetical protein BV25DRAFT_328926 [Artomyces pyxidatus]|uniref:Uncharacterized protein n=1 Tax=Artomyces pyxidatus TaxID=48021 RepID=A0ACB8T563_9AGAM|nr:hypothetical protein BV25DRAFT_328926 [Artomyces pyxidatus]
MSLESPSRPLPVSILSPQSSSPPSPAPMDATFPSIANTVPATLSHQAEPFTMGLMGPSSVSLDRRASSFTATASMSSDTESKDDLNGDVELIIEALKNKDRLFVLRLGDVIENLINERKSRIEVPTTTSYQRLLVHRCSAYYKVSPESDSSSKSIFLSWASESKIPSRRVADLVPAEATKQPAFKIMLRSAHDRVRSKPQSRTGSVGGEDLDLSDVEPSEAGSLGGRSSAPGSAKKPLTLEEREAAYNEARSRIFMDFEEKAKEKENDMSASSSTFSLVSGSASTSGGGSSSAGDIDDSISSAATESEWSGPVAPREKKDGRRGGSGPNSAGSSSRSLLSSAHASSSRNSRAPSPSFTYASIYEPSPSPSTYEAAQAPNQPAQTYSQPYAYPYQPPPGQAGQGYMAPFPYYPYPYPHPMSNSDPSTPSPDGLYLLQQPPHPQPMYMPPYGWAQNPGIPPGAGHSAAPSPSHVTGYPQYAPAPYGPYTMPGYFPPHHPHSQTMPHMSGQQPMYPTDMPLHMNGNADAIGVGNNNGNVYVRPPLRNGSVGNGNHSNGTNKRKTPRASAWSYGPGISGGFPGGSGVNGLSMTPAETYGTVGPRLSNSMRKSSGNSSGSAGNRTPGDESSSVASSTSSSSRRTFTSTTSSQHPLPARPDWAVGLKAQPTLHPTPPHQRHHDHNNHSGPMSPVRNGGRLPHGPHGSSAPVLLQSADFPPLTSPSGAAEKRTPVPRGAWTNNTNRSTILSPPAQQFGGPAGNGHTFAGGPNSSRLDEPDQAFERPQLKGKELFNPKARSLRPDVSSITAIDSVRPTLQDKEKDGLVEKMGGMGLEDGAQEPAQNGGGQP